MDGVLIIDKPAGPTSFEVVQRVRSLVKAKKAGHTGTLDPLATGILPVCLGEATKLAGFIAQADKAYDAVIRLGVETDTQDAAGKVVREGPVPALTREALEAALAPFRGHFLQVPPMYSAVKVAGKRLYERARAGQEVAREGRPVTVHELALLDFSAAEIAVRVRCSKGFFVRALAHDVGQALGCGGHLKALRRTASGPFTLQQAVSLDWLADRLRSGQPEDMRAVADRLIGPSDALSGLPAVTVSDADAVRVAHGLPLEVNAPPGRVRVLSGASRLLAVAEVGPDRRLRYLRVLA